MSDTTTPHEISTTGAPSVGASPTAGHWLALVIGNVALALGPWAVRVADTGPVSAGFWRLLLALPVLYLFARWSGEQVLAIPRRARILLGLAGFAFAFDLATWHLGIDRTRLGNATLFGNSGSIVLMVWTFAVARTFPAKREAAAIAVALAGISILMGRSLDISHTTVVGDLFSLAAGLFYATYLLALHQARKALGSWSLLVWISAVGAPVLLGIAVILGEPVWPGDWTPILLLSFGSQIVGQGLLVYALRHFTPLVVGLALLIQPMVAVLYGWLLFDEVLSGLDIIGMALLGGALVVAKARTR